MSRVAGNGCPSFQIEKRQGMKTIHTTTAYPVGMLKRLPLLREYLRMLRAKRRLYISAAHISADLNIPAEQLIQDINLIGIPCNAQINFAVNPLIDAIEIFLGFHKKNMAFIIGSGFMARAVINQVHDSDCGVQIVAAFVEEIEEATKIPETGIDIFPLKKLKNLAGRMHIEMGIIATSAEKAQEAADLMERAGIKVIWNCSGYPVKTSENIISENTDIIYDLAKLFRKIKDNNN